MERILGVGGSPRKGGNSDILLQHILRGGAKGAGVEEVQLRDLDYKPCQGCERCRKDLICTGVQDEELGRELALRLANAG